MMEFNTIELWYQLIFWLMVCLIIYIYIGYPALAAFIGNILANNINKSFYEPTVTILIAAYNEEKYIEQTIKNKLSLNYPLEKLEIIVISDESTDATDDIVEELGVKYPGRIKLLRQVARNGKTSALNMAVPLAKGEIIVFSDANSIYDQDALKFLLANLSDPKVGYVTGKMIYINYDETVIGDGCSSYMKYENYLRSCETRIGSIVGVDGGIDAARKNLYQAMKADQIPDFIFPLNVVEKGYRVVYEEKAILKESALGKTEDEYRMRVRVGLRSLWAIYDMRHLFSPRKYGFFAWQFLSHKFLRYTAFMPLIFCLILNFKLLSSHSIYIYAIVMQGGFYLLAYIGYMLRGKENCTVIVSLPYYFVLINIASAHAFMKFLKKEKQTIWKPRIG